jgi:hypothetical protein
MAHVLQNIIFAPSTTRRIFKNFIFTRMSQTLNIKVILQYFFFNILILESQSY